MLRREVTARFNPVFAPTHTTRCRYVAIMGGAGSGKSVDTAQFYILRLLKEPQRNLLAVRKINESNRVSTYAELTAAISRLGLQNLFHATLSPLQICSSAGNRVIFCGCLDAAQRAKLKSISVPGGKITDIWIEEATDLDAEDFEILDDRLRGELPEGLFYQIRMTFNPVSASHWIKKRFFDIASPQVFTHRSTYLDNRFCDPDYAIRMERRKQFDPDGYRVYCLGEWGESGGLILTNVRVEEFRQSEESFDAVSLGQDFGYNNPNALLMLGLRDGDIYVAKELYERELDTAELIRLAQEAGFSRKLTMYCDSAEPDRIHSWAKAGFRAVGAYKCAGSVKAEIDWLKQRRIHIHPECVNTVDEIQKWRWRRAADGSYTDEPTPLDDHAMSALRYGTEPWRRGREPTAAVSTVILPPSRDLVGRLNRHKGNKGRKNII